MSILLKWQALPANVQLKLSREYGVKSYGTTEAQLTFELQTKLPQGLLKEEIEEVGEPPVSTGKEPVIKAEKPVKPAKEVKEVKVKKTKKSK